MSRFDDEKFRQPQLKVKFNVIPKTRLKSFTRQYTGYTTGLVESEPGKFIMTPSYGSNAEKLYRLPPRKDDVWLLTFPKCGKIVIKSNILVRKAAIFKCYFNQEQLGLLNCCGWWWIIATRRKRSKFHWPSALPLSSGFFTLYNRLYNLLYLTWDTDYNSFIFYFCVYF